MRLELDHEKIYEEYFEELYSFIWLLVFGRQEEAEFVTSEIFIKFYRSFRDRPLPDNIREWLFTTAREECKEYFKRKELNWSIIESKISL